MKPQNLLKIVQISIKYLAIFVELVQPFCDFIEKPPGGFPTQAGIRYGFAIAVFADLLAARFNVAFNHNTFHHIPDLWRMAAAVKNFFYNANLLLVLFAGIGVVGIYDAGWVLQIPLAVQLMEKDQVFVVIVGKALPMLVDSPTQNGMG